MQVKSIMEPVLHTASANDAADEALGRMRSKGIDYLPVVQGNEIVGMLSRRELDSRPWSMARLLAVGDVMNDRVVTATPNMSLARAANLLRTSRAGCLPVVRGRQLVGILTAGDLLAFLGRENPKHADVRGSHRPGGQGKRPH